MKVRTRSLDVFRGITVALMILVNNPGSWLHIYGPFEHAHWHGYTLTDLVFPFFLFAVGNAMAIITPGLRAAGGLVYLKKIIKRTFLIFTIGFVLNWLPFFLWRGDELIFKSWTWIDIHNQIQGLRVFGVLQRVALAYGFAALVLYFTERKVFGFAFLILFLSTLLGSSFGGLPGPWSLEGYYGTVIDRYLFGASHLYHGEGVAFDPEGLMSTLGAVSQVLFGYLAGLKVMKIAQAEPAQQKKMLMQFLYWGLALWATGFLWSFAQPINKKIWTSSYTLITTGYAVFFIAIIHWRKWTPSFFEVFGRNALFIYCLSIFIPRFLGLIRIPGSPNPDGSIRYLTPFNWFYENGCTHVPGSPNNGSLVYALCVVTLYWIIAAKMDQRKIYIRV